MKGKNHRRSIFGILICLSVLSGCVSVKDTAEKIVLASNSRAEAVIVIPEQAPPSVRFAAEEIKRYLDKITGADFKIVRQIPEDGPAVVLGAEFAEKVGIDADKIKRDGYEIKTVNNKIYIAGKDDETEKSAILFTVYEGPLPDGCLNEERYLAIGEASWDFERGTLHAAYDFLERLGVRWFFAGPKGEVVPESRSLSITPVNVLEEPFYELRVDGRIMGPYPKYVKLGILDPVEYKMLGWTGRNQRLWLIRNRASSRWMAFNHRPIRHQWSQRFGKTNPEYFALLANGERANGERDWRHCYLNYTSEGMLDETVKDMDAFFSGMKPESRGMRGHEKFRHNNGWETNSAYGDTFTLLPNDGLKTDQSPKSRKYLREDRPLPFRHTNYIWQFVDKAARALKKKHPDKLITCLAYQSYWETPDPKVVEKLPDNVIVGIAALSGPSRVHTFMRDNKRKEFVDLLERWSKVTSAPLLFWDYWLWRYKQPDHKGVPMLLPHGAQDFVKTRAKYGKYMFMQHDSKNLVFELLNRYVMHRLLWNPDADVDIILDDYCDKSYGPAAGVMRSMFTDIEEKCLAIAGNNADFVAIWERNFDAETFKKYRADMTEAEKLVKGTKYEPNVELISEWFLKPMEEARKDYVKNIKELVAKGKNVLRSMKTNHRAMKIDGKMSERPWTAMGGKSFHNNVNGRYIRESAKLRIRHSDQSLFFFFDIVEPNAREILKKDKKDYVEIFLDPNDDRETYYWLYIPMDGKVTECFFPGPGEPSNDWQSEAKIVADVTDQRWTVEVEVPLKSIGLAGKNLEELEIGAMGCLTRIKHLKEKHPETFSTSNPILRGAFHQPGMFGRLRFVDPKKLQDKRGGKSKDKK